MHRFLIERAGLRTRNLIRGSGGCDPRCSFTFRAATTTEGCGRVHRTA
jgi:hypothetical protein